MVRYNLKKNTHSKLITGIVIGVIIIISLIGYFTYRKYFLPASRTKQLITWLREPGKYPEGTMERGTQCKRSIFLMPTSGFIGYLWDDSFKVGNHHQGIDIFAGTELGKTPIIAVYGGYLTRLPDWRSSVIIRIPEDPLQPDRQIWTYYTHMADADGNSLIDKEYPAGSYELPITAGTQIGYQGNFSGSNGYPVGVHLHFSIIRDDGYGNFLNELKIINTIDPSPYFNLALNAKDNPNDIVICLP